MHELCPWLLVLAAAVVAFAGSWWCERTFTNPQWQSPKRKWVAMVVAGAILIAVHRLVILAFRLWGHP